VLEAKDVARHVEIGQYWAQLAPLTLSQITQIADDQCTFALRWWTPRGFENYVMFVGPMQPDRFRYLWFSAHVPRIQFPTTRPLDVGDVWLVRAPNTPSSGLVFVGPESTETHVHLLSDWRVGVPPSWARAHVFVETHLLQEGPAQTELSTERARLLGLLAAFTNKPRPSSWDRVQGPLV